VVFKWAPKNEGVRIGEVRFSGMSYQVERALRVLVARARMAGCGLRRDPKEWAKAGESEDVG